MKDLSRDTFGCHYDEGRITRVLAPYEGEQILALRSTQQYSKLESISNMKIYNEVSSGYTASIIIITFMECALYCILYNVLNIILSLGWGSNLQ